MGLLVMIQAEERSAGNANPANSRLAPFSAPDGGVRSKHDKYSGRIGDDLPCAPFQLFLLGKFSDTKYRSRHAQLEFPEMTEASSEPLCLDQFLKLQGAVGTGGEAKTMIQSGEVKLNGVVETRRRKKLQLGDIVEIGGYKLKVGKDLRESDS